MFALSALVGVVRCHEILGIEANQAGHPRDAADPGLTVASAAACGCRFAGTESTRSRRNRFRTPADGIRRLQTGIVGGHFHDGVVIHVLDGIGHGLVAAPARLVNLHLEVKIDRPLPGDMGHAFLVADATHAMAAGAHGVSHLLALGHILGGCVHNLEVGAIGGTQIDGLGQPRSCRHAANQDGTKHLQEKNPHASFHQHFLEQSFKKVTNLDGAPAPLN